MSGSIPNEVDFAEREREEWHGVIRRKGIRSYDAGRIIRYAQVPVQVVPPPSQSPRFRLAY